EPTQPTVRIKATQPIAEETSEPLRRLPLRGLFTISRDWLTNEALPVFVFYSGTATSDDFPRPPQPVTIPAAAFSTTIRTLPNNDHLPEGIETAVAHIPRCPPDPDPTGENPCPASSVDHTHDR